MRGIGPLLSSLSSNSTALSKTAPSLMPARSSLQNMIEMRWINDLADCLIGGRAFWKEHFLSHRGTPKAKFFKALQAKQPKLSFNDVKALYALLLCHTENRVGADRFGALLEWFGPWKDFISNVRATVSRPWFFGELSNSQVLAQLAINPSGTFIVRLLPSQPGVFALDVLDDENRVQEVLIVHEVVNEVYAFGTFIYH